MAKRESHEFTDDNDASSSFAEESNTDDALSIQPEQEDNDDDQAFLAESDDPTATLESDEASPTAHKAAKLPDEQKAKHNITEKVVKTGWKKRRQSSDWRKVGINTLTSLPANISIIRSFLKSINWKLAQEEVLEGLGNTVVIVGQPNTGKSTLFNQLKGQPLSDVSPQAGTTKELIRTDFGPFTLVDTPGHLPEVMETGMSEASLIVFVVDGSKGLQPDDRNLLMSIKELETPTIVVVNKIDMLSNATAGDELANEVAMRLGVTGVIPISAREGTNVAEELIPAMIAASPEAALVIGRELPRYRREAAQRIIRNAALISLAAGLEPIPLIDIPILIGTQVRLVLRLAALYGEPINSADALKHARELITTMIGGLGLRYLAEQVAKAVPFGGDVVAGAIAGAATWSIGEVALEYYDGGKRLDAGRLRALTKSFYKRFRNQKSLEEMRRYVSENKEEPLLLEGPDGKDAQ